MRHIILIVSIFYSCTLAAQPVLLKGKVVEKTKKGEEPLPGALVFWQGTRAPSETDEKGFFQIVFPDSLPANLLVTMFGYRTDTILITSSDKREIKIFMYGENMLKEVVIDGKIPSTNISIFTPINTITINKKELLKAACCNLSESFETNASVDVNYTDAVSGAKQIQMLGLDGIYTQILSENLPLIRGMSSSYGLNYVPGTWVQSIQVTKGAGSVLNGYESITGQLNVELLKPMQTDKFYLNGYASHQKRYEVNTHYAHVFNPRLGTLFMAHVSDQGLKADRNKDGFLDMPLVRQYNVFNRWFYEKPQRMDVQLGMKAMMEERRGGQTDFSYDTDFGDTNRYGIGILNKQLESFTKTGFIFPNRPWSSIALMTSERYHLQEMYFGLKKYSGEQVSVYANGIWQGIIGNSNHKIKAGPGFIYDKYRETFNDSAFGREDVITGGYAEYTFSHPDTTVSLVLGTRGDYHSLFGFKYTARAHFKYNFLDASAIRLSAGNGWRTANIFVENASVFANSRQVMILENLLPEEAWNYGASFTHKFKKREAYFNVDFFRTDFVNQVVVDLEEADKVKFYNLKGMSYSNSTQVEFGFEPFDAFEVRLAYKHYDVKSTYSGKLLDKPFVPRDRAMVNLAYATKFEIWKFDMTGKWFASSRIPDISGNPEAHHFPAQTESYIMLNAQVTRKFRHFEVYLGAENILDRYSHALIDADRPFGPYFDASILVGPTSGILFYGGFRFSIEQKKTKDENTD
jgi:outer membrane receptor for ferrienterochelin and colicins